MQGTPEAQRAQRNTNIRHLQITETIVGSGFPQAVLDATVEYDGSSGLTIHAVEGGENVVVRFSLTPTQRAALAAHLGRPSPQAERRAK